MKRIYLAAAIGIFIVATSSANNHASSVETKYSVSDTIRPDTTKPPKPDTVMINKVP